MNYEHPIICNIAIHLNLRQCGLSVILHKLHSHKFGSLNYLPHLYYFRDAELRTIFTSIFAKYGLITYSLLLGTLLITVTSYRVCIYLNPIGKPVQN